MGELYAKFFLAIYLFFFNSPTGQTLRRIFACYGSNDAVLRNDVPLKVKKNTMAPMGKIKQFFKPVSYTHLRAHETGRNLVCRLLLEKKKVYS